MIIDSSDGNYALDPWHLPTQRDSSEADVARDHPIQWLLMTSFCRPIHRVHQRDHRGKDMSLGSSLVPTKRWSWWSSTILHRHWRWTNPSNWRRWNCEHYERNSCCSIRCWRSWTNRLYCSVHYSKTFFWWLLWMPLIWSMTDWSMTRKRTMMMTDWLHVSLSRRLCSIDRSFCDPCGNCVEFVRPFWKHPVQLSMNVDRCPGDRRCWAHPARNYQLRYRRLSDGACPVRSLNWMRDSAESDELHWQMSMTGTRWDWPLALQMDSKNGYVRFGVSFWNLPSVVENCFSLIECSRSIVYSDWFERGNHFRSIDIPSRR